MDVPFMISSLDAVVHQMSHDISETGEPHQLSKKFTSSDHILRNREIARENSFSSISSRENTSARSERSIESLGESPSKVTKKVKFTSGTSSVN